MKIIDNTKTNTLKFEDLRNGYVFKVISDDNRLSYFAFIKTNLIAANAVILESGKAVTVANNKHVVLYNATLTLDNYKI